MPIVETSSSSSSSSSSAIMNNINNPATTLPYPQQHHIAGASPLVSTTISFAQGEQYPAGNSGNTSGNANNTTSSRQSLDHAPPPYSLTAGNRGSTIISTGPPPPTEDQLFQIQELSPGPFAVSPSSSSSLGTGSSALSAITAHHQSTQYICADPMHDQQYLLVGSGNALHSIDLTFSNHQQQERQQGGVSSNNSTNYTGGGGASSVGNVVRTHIQGVAFKEIHCLEEIGLVVVIAGRNSRVRCYDYDSINRLVAYGHSAQGRGRVVEGGKLGQVKNMIQLRVETALQRGEDNNNNPSDGPYSSPPSGMQGTSLNRGHRGTAGSTTAPGGGGGTLPQQQNRHQHTTSLDRSSLLSPPPAWSDNSPGQTLESILDDQDTTATTASCATTSPPPSATATSNFKKHKQRPLSLGGLASLAQEHVMRKSAPKDHQSTDAAYNSHSNNKIPSAATAATNTSNSTPSSPSSATPGVTIGGGNGSNNNSNNGATPTKNKRLSQMASYLSQAAVNSNMAAHISNSTSQDASPEAVGWAWDFTKLKQTKDVIGLDFHYTTTTVFMTVVSKTAIDIYCRPRSTRGRKPPTPSGGGGGAGGNNHSNGNGSRTSYSGADTPGRSSISSIGGGMATTGATSFENPHAHRDYGQDPYEWKSYRQLYHPEAPSFMTVVKGPTEVTDIILGKGPRACVINVQDMSVTDLHRQETSSVIHGLSKKLGFRNSSLWHSFEKIPFDVPPHILFPAAAEAMYGSSERKGTYSRPLSVYNGGTGSSGYPASGGGGSGGGPQRHSRDNILQRPADQLSIHQQELNEQEREEAARGLALKLQNVQMQGASGNNNNLGVPYHPTHYRGSSSSSSPPSSPSSSNSSSSIVLPFQQPPTTTPAPPAATTKTKTRMVTSDEVLNLAFSQRTTGQLFLATYGSQSRIVDLQGKPQSRVVLDWGELGPGSGSGSPVGCPPQKVEFLKTVHDIYVVGFEKSSIVVFSLTRAKKVKEITKRDLIQATARAQSSASSISVPGGNGHGQQRFLYDGSTQPHQYRSHSPQPPPLPTSQTPVSSPPSGPTNTSTSSSLAATALALTNATSTISSNSSASIKFLGRDSMAEDSLGLFFSYCHPKNGVSICQLSVVPLLAPDELELIGYYP